MASKEELPPSGPPRIALKLTPDGPKQQQTDHDYITKLVRKIEPNLELTPRCSPLITSQSSAVIAEKVALATKLDPNYKATNFDAWYQVVFESGSSVKDSEDTTETPADFCVPGWCLKLTQQLHNVADVESVHALQTGPPPAVNPGDDPRSTNQGYLDAAPGGINARYAWGFPGGDGAGANIIDVEQGWNLNHEDLVCVLGKDFSL
jgi:serine protease